jgi:predicted PurR-regulated permease PerM
MTREGPPPPHSPRTPHAAHVPAGARVPADRQLSFRRLMLFIGIAVVVTLAYVLRGVLVPLFFAFLLAYALDPFVDRMEALRIPRAVGAIGVMVGIFGLFVTVLVYAIPLFLDELRAAAAELPAQLQGLEARVEPWLWSSFKLKIPHTMGDLGRAIGDKVQAQLPTMLSAAALALFGTLSYVAVILSALIVPIFALYLLIDFDRIVVRVGDLIPRRWHRPATDVARQVHRTLGGYVRGQLTANIVLGALYASGLRLVDIRLAVPIGVITGMLAFVPYVGFSIGLFLALTMAILDWHGLGTVLGVLAVMGGVQILDGTIITPRIVGRSVGLAPLEVLVTMMAAASLFGFLGVILAVPLGAVVKILIQRAVKAYLASDFYARRPEA